MIAAQPTVDYDHERNRHTLEGARRALASILPRISVRSVLDVGCGRGTWLRAASELAVEDVLGVDGVAISSEQLLFPPAKFLVRDLTQPQNLGRRFDLVLCLEVAEHLEVESADALVDNLARYGDTILFSAACPNQPGQHHVNCQWPEYWQNLFNRRGYVCDDWPRWQIWRDEGVEPWYRQNMFLAEKRPESAGSEPRIPSVMHPDMHASVQSSVRRAERSEILSRLARGQMSSEWIAAAAKGLGRRARGALWRRLHR